MSKSQIYYKQNEEPDFCEGNRTSRFVLEKKGKSPLIIFGINPSKADRQQPDKTINKVIRLSQQHKCDGWMMLNIYPQREQNPKQLDTLFNENLHKENMRSISLVLSKTSNATLCAAWGNNIDIRYFLKQCLHDIYTSKLTKDFAWKSIGPISKKGHPKHPLYLPLDLPLIEFDIKKYLS